jgi:hypothetical protein
LENANPDDLGTQEYLETEERGRTWKRKIWHWAVVVSHPEYSNYPILGTGQVLGDPRSVWSWVIFGSQYVWV